MVFFKKQAAFEVIGGQNLLKKSAGNIYRMIEQKNGVVKIKGRLYYFLGVHKEEKHSRSAGKAAAGAIVGGLLTGGLGAIAGAAVGGRKKDDSIYFMDLLDYEAEKEFTVQVKQIKNTTPLINFDIANID